MNTKRHNLEIDSIINEWCSVISEDLATRTFHDKAEVAAYAKIKLITAVSECLKTQHNSLESKRQELVEKYTLARNNKERFYLGGKIAEINLKLKNHRNAINPYSGVPSIKKKIKKYMQEDDKRIVGRLREIDSVCPKSGHRKFTIAASYNIDNPSSESNYVEFTMYKNKNTAIDIFNVGDIIVVQYSIKGSHFQGSDKTIRVTTLVAGAIGIAEFAEPDEELIYQNELLTKTS